MNSNMIHLRVNGHPTSVAPGANVAAAVAQVATHFRRSLQGEPRAPLCGMGVCFECRVRIDDKQHVRACMTPAREGMQVFTDD